MRTFPYGLGPDGAPLTPSDLPPRDTRWVARRKAIIVIAVRNGMLSFDDACTRYGLSAGEYREWENAYDRSGVRGLRVSQPLRRAAGLRDIRNPYPHEGEVHR